MSYDDRHDSMPAGLPYDVPGRGGAGVPQSRPPSAAGSPAQPKGRPTSVTIASVCLIADIAAFVVSFALVVSYQDELVAASLRLAGEQTGQSLPEVTPVFVRFTLFAFAVVQLLVSIGVAVLAILLLRRRRIPWIFAIALSWVFLVEQLLSFLSTSGLTATEIPQVANSLGQMLTGMSILLIGTAAVCLVLPSTVRWFRRPRR